VRPAKETAEMVFERIRRRRQRLVDAVTADGAAARPAATPATTAPPTAATPTAPVPPVRIDEVLFESAGAPFATADTFPRSASMRLILKHPAVALGVGIPAAACLLWSPGSRRLLGLALGAGMRAELYQLVQLSMAAARRAKSPPNAPPAQPGP
jgi:hypothetical protein